MGVSRTASGGKYVANVLPIPTQAAIEFAVKSKPRAQRVGPFRAPAPTDGINARHDLYTNLASNIRATSIGIFASGDPATKLFVSGCSEQQRRDDDECDDDDDRRDGPQRPRLFGDSDETKFITVPRFSLKKQRRQMMSPVRGELASRHGVGWGER